MIWQLFDGMSFMFCLESQADFQDYYQEFCFIRLLISPALEKSRSLNVLLCIVQSRPHINADLSPAN